MSTKKKPVKDKVDTGAQPENGVSRIEMKTSRFKAVAARRTNTILKTLGHLANCGNRGAYEYTDAQVDTIFKSIDERVAETRAAFRKADKKEVATVTL